jgi:adenosylcobinamide-GDP ribazoletransferase
MSALSGLTDWFDDLRAALAALTRLPLPHPATDRPGDPVRATRVYPLVGALIGGIVGVVYDALLNFTVPDLTAAGLALGASAILTGAMYERGLAATADSGRSGLGAAGALALLVSFTAKVGVLTSLPIHGTLATLVTAHALGRMPLPALAAWLPGIDDETPVPAPDVVVAALAFGVIIALLLLPFGTALTALIAALVAATAAAWWARRGSARPDDALGAAEQAAEIAVMLTVVAIWSE